MTCNYVGQHRNHAPRALILDCKWGLVEFRKAFTVSMELRLSIAGYEINGAAGLMLAAILCLPAGFDFCSRVFLQVGFGSSQAMVNGR